LSKTGYHVTANDVAVTFEKFLATF